MGNSGGGGMFDRLMGELTQKIIGVMDLVERLEVRHEGLETRVREAERSLALTQEQADDLCDRVKALEDKQVQGQRDSDKSVTATDRLKEDFDKFKKEAEGGKKTSRARTWEILTIVLAAVLGALFSRWLGL